MAGVDARPRQTSSDHSCASPALRPHDAGGHTGHGRKHSYQSEGKLIRRTSSERPRTAAERQRDCRARQRRGEVIYPLAFPNEMIREHLLEKGYLKEWDDDDFERVREALEVAFIDYVTRDGS